VNDAFLNLKLALTSEPVIRSPVMMYAVRCHIRWLHDRVCGGLITMARDNSQQWLHVRRLHPIAFASKRTSPAQERYKPFLLEFAGPPNSASIKFNDIIYGYPVELETDCQALRDTPKQTINSMPLTLDGGISHQHYNRRCSVSSWKRQPRPLRYYDGQFSGLPKVSGDGPYCP